MLATKNPYMESAYEQLQVISQDKQKRLEYEAREKAVRDYNQLMYEAEQRGEQRGREAGMKVGEQRGREAGMKVGEQRGRKAGEYEKTISVIHNMMTLNFPIDTICQITGLSRDEVQKFMKD